MKKKRARIYINSQSLPNAIPGVISGSNNPFKTTEPAYKWNGTQPTENNIMKENVINYLRTIGASAHYSGKVKTMYIRCDAGAYEIIEAKVMDKFGKLPFKLSK